MLKIRSEQIRVFQADADEAFIRRVMDYLRANHPHAEVKYPGEKAVIAEIPDDILRENVRGGILRAGSLGVTWKSTLISFVVLMFLTAPNFYLYPKAAQFFEQTENLDDKAMEGFLEEMTDEDWSAVEVNYNAGAWSLPVKTEGEK